MSVTVKGPAHNLTKWPRVMRQPSTGQTWLVDRHNHGANGCPQDTHYFCYIVETGTIVRRDSYPTDLENMPPGTTLTITNE